MLGGVLILSEKLVFIDKTENQLQIDWHLSSKRAALENVLIPDTFEQHQKRLKAAGFSQSYQWFQSLNFASLIALKI